MKRDYGTKVQKMSENMSTKEKEEYKRYNKKAGKDRN